MDDLLRRLHLPDCGTISIRAAVRDDAAEIAQIHIDAWQSAYRGLMPDAFLDGMSVVPRTERWYKTLSDPGKDRFLVAERDGRISGWVAFGPARIPEFAEQGWTELIALNVAPACWRSGLGSAMLQRVVAEVHERHGAPIYLWVIRENARAQALYSRAGFVPDGGSKTEELPGGGLITEMRMILDG